MQDTGLCGCGSSLREVRCCGLMPAALPGAQSLELLNPQAAEATRLYNEKKHQAAESLALKLLDLAPNHRMALRVLFELRNAGGQLRAAEALSRRLATLPADNPAQASAANLTLARLLIGQNRYPEAEPPAREAVRQAPRDADAHHLLAVVFTEMGELSQGERHFRLALALRGEANGVLLGNFAWNLRQQGLLEEAAQVYGQALAARPDNGRAIIGYAQVETARGDFAHAARLLDAALVAPPADRGIRLQRAMLEMRLGRPRAALERLRDQAGPLPGEPPGEPPAELPAELLLRGEALLRNGEAAAGLAAFTAARTAQRERFGLRYAATASAEKAARARAFFTADRLAPLPRAPVRRDADPLPVFLLGFPGSGTSLLEQLMARIEGIAAGDAVAPIAQLLALPELARYPDCLTETVIGTRRDLAFQLRRRFLDQLRAAGFATPTARFVTLRAAGDAWHLGLVRLLFPEAPVIHLLRHPLDIVAANFGRDRKLEAGCFVSLTALATHYALVMSLIRHYRGQLTLRYLPVRYEDLIAEPARVLAGIGEFIGAPPPPPEAVLRENAPIPVARRPGHAIAQQPIHRRGLSQHLEFEAAVPGFFAEIRPILAPWIAELGYPA